MGVSRWSRPVSAEGSRRFGRYTTGAWAYDLLALEWPIYRAGRRAGIGLLRLRPGDRVLDIGCGTGLNFEPLNAVVGATGTIIGLDVNAPMLARAHARTRRHDWVNVRLVRADAGRCDLAGLVGAGAVDAVLFTYALSVIEDGPAAWASALPVVRPGGRLAVVDLALPTGRAAVLAPAARLACLAGGARLGRQPWRWVARDTGEVEQRSLRAGHIRVAAGTAPERPDRPFA
ncbi:MAG TPA: methyltransferase domain-containing protein [Mycobacteriales bacterium]|nr:methyltransferase domain-containing protein [Mycobacteriales bacterium]